MIQWSLDQSIFPDKRMMHKEVHLLQVDTKNRLGFPTGKNVFVTGKRREQYNLCWGSVSWMAVDSIRSLVLP